MLLIDVYFVQANQPYDSTHASLLQNMGNLKPNQERMQPTRGKLRSHFDCKPYQNY